MSTAKHAGKSHDTHKSHAKAEEPDSHSEKKKEAKDESTDPTPFQQQVDKVSALVQAVKDAFVANGFVVPGDIEIQVRNMAAITPHPVFPPESVDRTALATMG